jgi:hypothetical protein
MTDCFYVLEMGEYSDRELLCHDETNIVRLFASIDAIEECIKTEHVDTNLNHQSPNSNNVLHVYTIDECITNKVKIQDHVVGDKEHYPDKFYVISCCGIRIDELNVYKCSA